MITTPHHQLRAERFATALRALRAARRIYHVALRVANHARGCADCPVLSEATHLQIQASRWRHLHLVYLARDMLRGLSDSKGAERCLRRAQQIQPQGAAA